MKLHTRVRLDDLDDVPGTLAITVDLDHPAVRHYEWCPGDGTRYTAFVSPLPADLEGGSADRHSLLTVYSPLVYARKAPMAYVFVDGFDHDWALNPSASHYWRTDDDLHARYLAEKLHGLADLRYADTIMELVAMALHRPLVGVDR